ncbi:MAG: gluconate:H+ symporter [Chitinophagaceae bacterium]
MTLLIVLVAILLLVALIAWGKVNAFLAFLVVSILAGLALGISLIDITKSVYKGIGDTLGSLVIIIVLGAMLGKLVAESGAAQKIATVMMKAAGEKYIQWALMVTGFIIGIPLFYNVGFVLIIPMIFSIIYRYKMPAMFIALPMLAPMSVAHGFLPPHPSPAALVLLFKADMGLTLLYGILIAIPVMIVAGPLFSKTVKNIVSTPLKGFAKESLREEELPGAANSFLTALLPVVLLTVTTLLLNMLSVQGPMANILVFFGEAGVVMLISVIVATFTLGINMGKSMKFIMDIYAEAGKDVAMVLLIIAGAGVLKQVLIDSGVSDEIAAALQGLQIHPLVLGWLIAAIIRVCLGSATVAGLTTAGIIAPMMLTANVEPNLMVLAIGAGSLMFSHVNDGGFWLFKEYFNLSIKDTIRTWSVMESIVAIMGLAGVLLLSLFIT